MKLLSFEMKKIWSPLIIAVLLVLGIVYGYLFLSFSLTNFPHGHPMIEQYDLIKSWTARYGTTMDVGERLDAEQGLSSLYSEAKEYILSDVRFSAAKIYNYDDYTAFYLEANTAVDPTPADLTIANLLYTEEFNYIGYRIDTVTSALIAYDIRNESLLNARYDTLEEQQRIENLVNNEMTNGIMAYEAVGNLDEYSRWCSIFLILSVTVLISPTLVRDRLNSIQSLQWSSKTGRCVLRRQFGAVIISAIILIVVELVIMVGLYSMLGTKYFWNSPLTSFFYGNKYWFDMSYGQYILLKIAFAVTIALGAVGIMFCLSRHSANYISLLMKLIPAFALLAVIGNSVVCALFQFGNSLYKVTHIVGIEAYCATGVCIVGIVCATLTIFRERKNELA